jgi:cytochrome c-type biogenesis protein CcmH/NrfG
MVDKTLSAAELPRLVVHLPDGKEVHHAIVGTEITIGRDPSNRIAISDQFVSKFHAKLLVSSSSLTLVDLGSANKTYVNGQPISQMPVKFGDELQFAGVRCRLLAPESQAQSAAAPPAKPVPKSASVPAAAKPAAAPKPAPAARAKAPAPPRPSPAAPPPAVPGRSAPPPIEADPMKRLLRIGGLLILVSLALGILLRVLLVPGKPSEPGSETADKTAGSATTTAPAEAAASSTTTAPVPAPAGTSGRAGSAEEWFDQALSYLDTGRLKEAQMAFRKVLEIDPNNTRAKTRLSLLDEEIAKKAEQHFGNARQAFQFLRYEEAIAEWEMFLTLADASDVRYVEAQQGIEQAKAKLR